MPILETDATAEIDTLLVPVAFEPDDLEDDDDLDDDLLVEDDDDLDDLEDDEEELETVEDDDLAFDDDF